MMPKRGFLSYCLLASGLALGMTGVLGQEASQSAGEPPVVQMLLPGFTVQELPVELTAANNIEYGPDGKLYVGGYDGRFHVLRDLDGDGLEEKVDTLPGDKSGDYPLGVAVKDGMPHFLLA